MYVWLELAVRIIAYSLEQKNILKSFAICSIGNFIKFINSLCCSVAYA